MSVGTFRINVSRPRTSPEEKEVGVVLHHGVGLAGQIAQTGQVES